MFLISLTFAKARNMVNTHVLRTRTRVFTFLGASENVNDRKSANYGYHCTKHLYFKGGPSDLGKKSLQKY